MEQKPKKAVLAAITAAVMNYIKSGEEATALAMTAVAPAPAPAAFGSLYGVSGRQQMMEMRRLLSLRLLR